MLLGSGAGSNRLTVVEAVLQVIRLSRRRSALDGKTGQIVLLEQSIVETVGEQYIAISGISRYGQSIAGYAIAGSRRHGNLL
jgi:hypothetical protein